MGIKSAAVLEVNELTPSFILEAEHLVRTPVNCVDIAFFAIRNCGHCEGEAIDGHLDSGLGSNTSFDVQGQTLIEVFASETTHDEDGSVIELSCSETLASRNRCCCTVLILD